MKVSRVVLFALAGALAITGCVSLEQTQRQIKSANQEEVKKGEDNIYWAATSGQDATGFISLTTEERIEYVKLTSNQELLIRIIEDSDAGDVIIAAMERVDFSGNQGALIRIIDKSSSGSVIEAALEKMDFSKNGIAKEFVSMHLVKLDCIARYEWDDFGRRYEDVSSKARNAWKTKIISHLSESDILELLGDPNRSVAAAPRSRMSPNHPQSEGMTKGDRQLLMARLIEATSDVDVLWKIYNGGFSAGYAEKDSAMGKLLTLLDKVTDEEVIEKLLSEYNNGKRLVNTSQQRILLMKKLPEDKMVERVMKDIENHSVYTWNDGNLSALETGIGITAYVKDTKTAAKILAAVLAKIAKYRKDCQSSWTMSWDASDEGKARKLIAGLPALPDAVIATLVCYNESTWKYLIDKVTAESAYNILTKGKAKSAELEEALIKKLPTERIDMQVYEGVKTDAGKKAVLAAMPEELKNSARESAEKAFAAVLEKAKDAAKETFELHGFYLGMDWEDMKLVLAHHFPDLQMTEKRDGSDADADYVVYVPKQRAPFCYASAKDKKVYQFNFGKAILKKWYKYDVQTFVEWVRAYSRENNIEMVYKEIEKEATVYEPMDMSQSYRVWFNQDSYQYKHNTKEYRLIYFGEEKDFTIHGGLGGDLIKEAAAPKFRYVRGDPGSLRVKIEND